MSQSCLRCIVSRVIAESNYNGLTVSLQRKFTSLQVTLMKNFGITERAKLGVGATAFDIFNHPNFDQPVGDIANPSFGTILSTVNPPTSIYGSFLGGDVSPRVIQLNARLTF